MDHTGTRETSRGECNTSSDLVRVAAKRDTSDQPWKEEKINGAYGNRHRLDRDDTVRYGKLLDTPNRRGDEYMYHSSFGLDIHHDCHQFHPYGRSDRGYL